MNKKLKLLPLIFTSIVAGLLVAGLVFAWTNPSGNPTTGGGVLYYYNGNVGIGMTNPTYKLQLATDSAAKPSTNTWTVASDARLKDVAGVYNRGLNEILQINPIRYTYKQNNGLGIVDPGEHIGIIAQDVQKVMPEAISVDPNGYFHFTADPVIWASLNAVKELNTKIIEQQKEIDYLKAAIEELKNK